MAVEGITRRLRPGGDEQGITVDGYTKYEKRSPEMEGTFC
jgi:hypothetical protein